MTLSEFVRNLFENSDDYTTRMDIETARQDLDNFRRSEFDMPEGITPEDYMESWNELVDENKEDETMKTISYNGTDIEITAVRFTYGTETTAQEGILVHDTSDEFSNGDAIYGNGWNIGMINDSDDVESLLTSGDGSTYWHQNDDGTYTVEA